LFFDIVISGVNGGVEWTMKTSCDASNFDSAWGPHSS
jgi:hypothetical protein